jgi:RNA polymerase sigma-70 factor, ECF subfamily
MDRLPQRSTDVDDALCEPLPRNAARPADEAGAFDALYRRAFPRVYAYAASLLRDRAAAEDVTALAFERAYRRRHRYRASRGTADAWLFGIARNAALDELRRRRRGAALHGDVPEADAPAPEDLAGAALRREVVRRALDGLDPRERELVALKFAGGLGNAEIARVLGISESAAGTRLHRTIEKLRKACDEDR